MAISGYIIGKLKVQRFKKGEVLDAKQGDNKPMTTDEVIKMKQVVSVRVSIRVRVIKSHINNLCIYQYKETTLINLCHSSGTFMLP
jgi:hypothetical protein